MTTNKIWSRPVTNGSLDDVGEWWPRNTTTFWWYSTGFFKPKVRGIVCLRCGTVIDGTRGSRAPPYGRLWAPHYNWSPQLEVKLVVEILPNWRTRSRQAGAKGSPHCLMRSQRTAWLSEWWPLRHLETHFDRSYFCDLLCHLKPYWEYLGVPLNLRGDPSLPRLLMLGLNRRSWCT